VRQAEIDAGWGQSGALTTDERAELAQLRREVRTLRMERDILKNQSGTAPTVPPVRRETGDAAMLIGALEAVAVSFMVTREPIKKHGPGVACALDSGDAVRRSRLGK
jgi:transposase